GILGADRSGEPLPLLLILAGKPVGEDVATPASTIGLVALTAFVELTGLIGGRRNRFPRFRSRHYGHDLEPRPEPVLSRHPLLEERRRSSHRIAFQERQNGGLRTMRNATAWSLGRVPGSWMVSPCGPSDHASSSSTPRSRTDSISGSERLFRVAMVSCSPGQPRQVA